MQPSNVEVVFVRHGESVYNDQASLLRQKLGIGATWEEYRANPEFMKFKYSHEMLDCGLSEHGQQQCRSLAGKLDDVDLVLVSPLYRALSSCAIIFRNYKKGPVICEPLISESLRCACDVSFNLPRAMQEWPHFDFSRVAGREADWYIANQQAQKQELYESWLALQQVHTYEERAKCLNDYMEKTHNFEDSFDLIARSRRIRERLEQYAREHRCSRMAVVSHFYTIGYTVSEEFDTRGKPMPNPHIANATPYEYILPLGISKENKSCS